MLRPFIRFHSCRLGRIAKGLGWLALGLGCLLSNVAAQSSDPTDPLKEGFATPPNSARPRVWWHWMNGNITKDGIRKDIEWMSRIGIGGMQNFDAGLRTPQVVDRRISFMTPEWKDAFRHAAQLAAEKDLELAIASSPGWSETGGPWIPPQDGMKKLVWSEHILEGGQHFQGSLPPLPSVTGPYQDMPMGVDVAQFTQEGVLAAPPTFCGDTIVIAYPVAEDTKQATGRYSAEGNDLDAGVLNDHDTETFVELARPTKKTTSSIEVEFDAPETIRSATLFAQDATAMFIRPAINFSLEAANESGAWRKIAEVESAEVPTTVSFPAVTASRFRVVPFISPPRESSANSEPAPGSADFAGAMRPDPAVVKRMLSNKLKLAEFHLSCEPRIDRAEAKAGFTVARDYRTLDSRAPDVPGVAPEKMIDLTSKMSPGGRLDWTPPAGRWKVLRIGYSLVGKYNHPASAEGTGLEVDKYDGEAVRRYLETYLGLFAGTTGPELIGTKGLRALLVDSIEVGPSNWTPRILTRFQELRGYDPRPWLPVLAGVIVGSRTRSDAFLFDFRRTLADLIEREHYAQIAAVARQRGLVVYGESLEGGRACLGDDLAMRAHADVPMSAMWTYQKNRPRPSLIADMRGAASVAHVNGQNLVAAESMTSSRHPWAFAPCDLKKFADLEFAHGVNRIVIHTSVHQPVDDKVPGLSLLFFGQYFNRHESWAELAKPWLDYLARSSFLLQQGRFFADVAYFYGEEPPLGILFQDAPLRDLPVRYAYDFVNAAMLAEILSGGEGGALVATSGARFRILYLGGASDRLTLETLKRLAALAESGATIVGNPPVSMLGLGDRTEFEVIRHRLWDGGATTKVGKGRVIASRDIDATLAAMGVEPDFAYTKPQPDSEVLFVHRRLLDGDVYFVNNRRDHAERFEARFRVTGKAPQIWRADTRAYESVSYRMESDVTVVPLEMLAEDAFFVVFRESTTEASKTVTKPDWQPLAGISGEWKISFQPGRGAPEKLELASLGSLTEHTDPRVKYFSGVVTYHKTFVLPSGWNTGTQAMLDLGNVGDIAEIHLNGRLVGHAWKAPWQVEIGAALQPGENHLEVRVANLWVNRLIGDAQPDAQKVTYTTLPTYRPDAPLRPSGLLGPVKILTHTP